MTAAVAHPPLSRYALSAVLRDDRIEIRGPFNEQLQEFYASLPGGKWDRARGCWTCHVTPACCWRITSQAPCAVEADEDVMRMGHRFYEPVLRPGDADQFPPVENFPSRAHQRRAFAFAFPRDATLLDEFMGLGKSKTAVDLIRNWGCRKVLIVCPAFVRGVWRREFAKHAPDWAEVLVLERGTTVEKVQQAQRFVERCEMQARPCVVVVNYETAKRSRKKVGGKYVLREFAEWSLSQEWDCAVGDESHRFKGDGTDVADYMARLGRVAKRRLALSGTPMAHSPLDVFPQFEFLDRGIFGTSMHRFRHQFAIPGPFGATHVVGFKNLDELARRMALITFHAGAECLDLPPVQHIDIPFTLWPESRRLYDEMESDLIAFVRDGGEVTAGNGLVKLLRLQQICSGFVVDDDENVHQVGTEKRDTLSDLLSDLNEPVVSFCVFHQQLDAIRTIAESLGRRHGEISGRQKDLTPQATMPEGIDVLGVQIQSGGVGIDLTRSRVGVYYAPCYSLGDYDQSLSRLNRPGQTRPCVFYHLVGEDTIDRAIYRALEKKRSVVGEVISYLKGESEANYDDGD